MLVRDVMRPEVVTVGPRARLGEALERMRARGIRHLPVLADGALVGIVSDRDLKRAIPPGSTAPELAALAVEHVMTHPVIATAPTVSVEEAGRVMLDHKISALPVTEGGRLVGIVTETDVVSVLVRALGACEPSSRLEIPFSPDGSALAEIVRVIEAAGVPIASIVTLATGEGSREAIVRLATIDPRRVVSALQSRGYAVRGFERP